MTATHAPPLVPCPICGRSPDRFFVGQERIEVIACQNGCKPNVFAFVVHITSRQVDGLGWDDLGDVWNTIRVVHDDAGNRGVRFDPYPPGKHPTEPEGQFMDWTPTISRQRIKERADWIKANGEPA